MNSTLALKTDGDSINHLTDVDSRTSLLASDSIDFFPSENKIHSTSLTHPAKSLTAVIIPKETYSNQQTQMNCVDHNKNSFSNSYITLNGNKEKPVINGNKEKFILNGSKERLVEDVIPTPKTLLYTGKIHVDWKQQYKIGAGLMNLGNTCFMNTVIQCLTYCPPLANYLLHDNDHPSKCTITGFCMMCLLQKHMKRAIGKSGDVIKPQDVYERLKLIAKHFQHGRQEDAHEFLRYVIDNLWKSSLSQNNGSSKLDPASKETTVINQIFGGYHRSQVTCLRCKGKSNTFDHFMDFILDIKQNVLSLEKALEKFIQPELLEQENSYKCPKCKMKVTAQKRFTVYKAPNVATFQLKRFDYNRSFGGKITKQITYPEKLNLRPYMSDSKGEPIWYRLNAVLVHTGPTCNSGHYYCYVKNSNNLWYIMDDQRVHQVSLTQVLGQSAYVLFYIKVSSTEGAPVKKSFENRNSFMKVNSPAYSYKKIPEMSPLKSSPLTENNQSRQSSPKLKQHVYPTINLNKRNGLSPNINRERISFGIRPVASSTLDSSKSVNSSLSPAKKMKSSPNASKLDNNHTGLVPYIEDSSESSDENDNRLTNSKVECSATSLAKSVKTSKPDGAKFSSGGSNSFPKFEVRKKLSKPVLNPNRFSPSNSSNCSSTSSNLIATGVWTVTDATVASPGADSNSSFSSVHSTTDWHVTTTNDNHSNKSTASSLNCKQNTEFESEKWEEKPPLFSNGEVHSPPVQNVKKMYSVSDDSKQAIVFTGDCDSHSNETLSSNKQCDFRKQETESNKAFRDEDENAKKHGSFLKRKCCDSDQKFPKDSDFCNSENQYSPVPKKIKCTSDSLNCDTKLSLPNSNNRTDISEKYNGDNDVQIISYENSQHSNSNNLPTKTVTQSETNNFLRHQNDAMNSTSRCSSVDSSLEYEWVEKTKEHTKNRHQYSKGNRFSDKEERSNFGNSANNQRKMNKTSVVEELGKNSNFFYGVSVPTWKGKESYRDTITTNKNKRQYFDSYEDEFDRGKVRKFRPKERYPHYRKQNPFQRLAERNYRHKHQDRHHNGNYYKKPYNPHQRWKSNNHHDFQRWKY